MYLKRNFKKIYEDENDPWSIGDADSERYDFYYSLIIENSIKKNNILDIGCGYGAFLNRFSNYFQSLTGVELVKEAVEKASKKYGHIKFLQGSANQLSLLSALEIKYDTIIFSDVIYYMDGESKRKSLQWIADHLHDDGMAFIAAHCTGSKYLTFEELKILIQQYFFIEKEFFYEPRHAVFIVRKKRKLIAVTIDYETWHLSWPQNPIDWEKDIFTPTEKFIQMCRNNSIKLTFMPEMGEYFWLLENRPEIAEKMEKQWRELIMQGHDIQLHLHPNWLPELGASFREGNWFWDWDLAHCANYPHDLSALFRKCKETLENIIRPIKPDYKVNCFRAGTYRVQPFKRIYNALVENEIFCDTSVYKDGLAKERGIDFTLAYSSHQPYFANSYDPQLKAPPREKGIVELPIFTYKKGKRWFLDGEEGLNITHNINYYLKSKYKNTDEISIAKRSIDRLRIILRKVYHKLHSYCTYINFLFPKLITRYFSQYEEEINVKNDYFVMIGHTKEKLNFDAIFKNLQQLDNQGFEFVKLSDMAELAKKDLHNHSAFSNNSTEEAKAQYKREYDAIMGESRNEKQSFHLQNMIPKNCKRILDFGCGAGYWSARIANILPEAHVTGIDYGDDFIAKANKRYSSRQISFVKADFSQLPFEDASFDCVYADSTLEHAFDVDKVLKEIFRVLCNDGVLIALIPSDARNPEHICDNHTWKTAPHEVHMRLSDAGFTNITIDEFDNYKKFQQQSYPPADDKKMYVYAQKKDGEDKK